MLWAADVLLRVDLVMLVQQLGDADDEGHMLDTDNPLIMLNELDNLGSASLLVDMLNPARDGLVSLFPPKTYPHPHPSTLCQKAWVVKLRKQLVLQLFGTHVADQIKQGQGNKAILR